MEFLKLKQLTPNLVQYILHSIAMVTENTSTLEVVHCIVLYKNKLSCSVKFNIKNVIFLCVC